MLYNINKKLDQQLETVLEELNIVKQEREEKKTRKGSKKRFSVFILNERQRFLSVYIR
mgnify:FL=1|jgi:hypothetical protein